MRDTSTILRRSLPLLLAVLLANGCNEKEPAGPSPISHGALTGTVTLLGTDGPANPAAQHISLYASLEDLEVRRATYRSALHRISGPVRTFEFSFPTVNPGEYYVIACFEIGCGDYRDPETGAWRGVRIQRGRTTRLVFGL